MFFVDSTFLGIDPSAGEKPFVYAALDHELKLLALGEGSIDDILAFAAGQSRAMAAICAPRRCAVARQASRAKDPATLLSRILVVCGTELHGQGRSPYGSVHRYRRP